MTTIQVTADHIARGIRKMCTCCPVALALRDAGYPHAEAGVDDLYLSRELGAIPIPPECANFIPAFDEGCPDLQPFSFQIETP